jgi:hypothetical protein
MISIHNSLFFPLYLSLSSGTGGEKEKDKEERIKRGTSLPVAPMKFNEWRILKNPLCCLSLRLCVFAVKNIHSK